MRWKAVAEDEMVYRDETMAWEWINNSPIPHPMHIHNVQFQVVQRTTAWATSSYATVNQGFVDSGWKDTVLVWPGERVKIAMTFGPHTGHVHVSLPHPGARRYDHDAQLDDHGPDDAACNLFFVFVAKILRFVSALALSDTCFFSSERAVFFLSIQRSQFLTDPLSSETLDGQGSSPHDKLLFSTETF